MKKFNENGRSMVEMLGVLAIIGVLSVGGIAGYSKAMNKYKINKTTDQVSMLVANIRTIFSSQGNYAGLKNSTAKKFGVVPNDMWTSESDEAIKNAFNGAVAVVASQARTQDTTKVEAFTIEYGGMSQEACVTVSTGDWGSGQASGLIGIAAGVETTQPTGTTLGTIGELVAGALTDSNSAATAAAAKVLAIPGSSVPTPITVAQAVTACDGAQSAQGGDGAGYGVAWKYY